MRHKSSITQLFLFKDLKMKILGVIQFVILNFILITNLYAQPNPVPVQFFYVPLPEDQILQCLQTINTSTGGNASTNPVQTYISLAAIANNTLYGDI